jgi:UMF1 family MFS transporter
MRKDAVKLNKDVDVQVTCGEIAAWAAYDVANSTYATVVATAVYNAYFVSVIAGGANHEFGTLLLTAIIAAASFLVVLTAPVLGTIADATASKKRILLGSTLCCIIATALLSAVQPGQYVAAVILLIIANVAFGTGEDFIASFLPELAPKEKMGRISAIGWGAGYIGGLFSLGAALAYVQWARGQHLPETHYVPVIMLACAASFAVLCTPTVLFMRERAQPDPTISARDFINVGFARLRTTFSHARHYRDLFGILLAIFMYSCGTTTVTHIASVYAKEVMKFSTADSLLMILVVDLTAAIGAFVFGYIQDKIGSIRTLTISLLLWTLAVGIAYFAHTKMELWIGANFVGISMGACGSAGRALVGRFSPPGRSGEFLGLWGVAVKLATCVGVLSFGAVTFMTGGDLRTAMLCLSVFFVMGIFLVQRVDEQRGIQAAQLPADVEI